MKRQRIRTGNVYKIDLADGTHVYAREGSNGSTAVYDSRTILDLSVDDIVRFPVLFFVCVMKFAIHDCIWPIVGHRSIREAPLPEVPPNGIRDIHDKNVFRIYFNNGLMRSATFEEIKDLEPAMLWHPERVSKRILDHYLGFPDRWKESLPSYYPIR